jgi:hypothetical protein
MHVQSLKRKKIANKLKETILKENHTMDISKENFSPENSKDGIWNINQEFKIHKKRSQPNISHLGQNSIEFRLRFPY